jgi:DNA repair exonuclease SbcCD ATPase subunit
MARCSPRCSAARVADRVEEVAGRLYGLPLEDFTRERDAAAKDLRKAKERDAAAAVAKLPKPSQASWAANTLARERRDLVDALLDAADDLREAQEGAVSGKGAGALREATAAQRAAVDALLAAATDLRPSGRKPSEQTLERLRTTLTAVATDEGVREALDQGRLVEDASGAGAWGLVEGADVPAAPPRKPRRTKPKEQDGKRAEREAAERERRQQLEAELREARAERRSRDRELDRAEKATERAAKRLEDALAAAEDAREQADEARSDLDAARTAAEEARDITARLEEQLD